MITFEIDRACFRLVHLKQDIFRKDMAGHSHSSSSYELHYVRAGSGTLFTESGQYPLAGGTFFVTGPNVYHRQCTNPSDPMLEISAYLQVTSPKNSSKLLHSFLQTHFHISHQPQLMPLFELLIREQTQQAFGYQTVISGALQQLIPTLCRLYLPHSSDKPLSPDTLNDRRFLIIEEAFIYHASELTLSALAEQVGLCSRQVQRLLQKYYGMSFREKKKEACGLL